MKEKFKDTKLTGSIKIKLDDVKGYWVADKETIVAHIIRICEQYKRAGDTLTLRQLYYQLVANDLIPNHDKVYNKLGKIKDDIVYSGLVDWNTFEDRGRKPVIAHYEDSVASALKSAADYFRLHRQSGQPVHIEVWTEKDAISGILRKVTMPYNVDLVINKGYSSSTAMYEAYDRFVDVILSGKKVLILYFGDHDPSGLDMIRDIDDRIMFMLTRGEQLRDRICIDEWWESNGYSIYDVAYLDGYEKVKKLGYEECEEAAELFYSGQIHMYIKEKQLFRVEQIGLTMEQIKMYNPPHNPAKITDPRAANYVREFGNISWEVDALTPSVMRELVERKIKDNMDLTVYNALLEKEAQELGKINKIIEELDE